MVTGRKRVLQTVIFLLVVLTLASVYFLTRPAGSGRPNVLWITMDSLRADHLGCYGYNRARTPRIDALAAEGVRFAQCVSQASYTRISVPSMITAKYPFFLNLRVLHGDLEEPHVTVAEALSAEGYFTCAIAEPWPPGFFQGLESLDVQERQTQKKTRRCLQILEDLDQRPFFIWLYYWDPHAPYEPSAEFLRAQPGPTPNPGSPPSEDAQLPAGQGSNLLLLAQLNSGAIILSEPQRQELIRRYDAEIASVDNGIGQVIDALKTLKLWDHTIVILNADHGEAFGEHGLYYHSHSLYEEEIRVPCIIKPPRSRAGGRNIAGSTRNLDIFPTVLDYCSIPAPAGIQGQSLRPFIETERSPDLPSCLETHSAQRHQHLMAYRGGGYKLICQLPGGKAELYDLSADPGEKEDLLSYTLAAPGDRALKLQDELRERMFSALGVDSFSELEISNIPEMDAQTEQRLRALGYID